jgi:tetratricopeptide (TPR) repeat protein
MHRLRPVALALVGVLALVSCNRDPNVAKRRYVESGNKYFDRGRYKEASIQYRNAIKLDPHYGEAHYRLALTDLKLPTREYVAAVRELRRSVELIGPADPHHWDSVVKLTEIYVTFLSQDEAIMKEAEDYCKQLLQLDPNSFDGHRLTGDMDFVKARDAVRQRRKEDFQTLLNAAIAEYRRADSIKPGDRGVTMQLARGLVLSNDLTGAESLYRSVLDREKTFLQGYQELYQLLLVQNKPADADTVLQTAYRNNPKEYQFLILRAQLYLAQNHRDDMLAVLQQIKSKAGEYPRAYFDVGDFYLRVGDGDSAIREYRDGIAKDPKNKAGYQKGIIEVLMKQNKRPEAAKVNDEILKDNPNDPDARGLAASFLLERGDITQALVALQQVVARAPQNPVAHYNLGRAYFLHGQPEQARQEFNRAIELRTDYMAARLALAQLQVVRGEYDEAQKAAQEILQMDPSNRTAMLIQSQAMMGQRKYEDSRAVLAGILKANPSSTDAIFQTGIVDLQENKFKEAEEAFRKAYELNPGNIRGLMGEVQTLLSEKQPDKAVQRLQSEIAKTPTRLDLHYALANLDAQIGRYGAAIDEYRMVLDAQPKAAKARGEMGLRIGEMQRLMGDFGGAVNSFQAARQILPDDPRVLSSLAIVLGQANRWKESRQFYEATLKLDPNNGNVLNNLAYGMSEHNEDLDQALSWAQRAKQLKPNSPDVADTLGWIYLKKNLPDNALEIFQDLVNRQPNQPTFRYHLAMAMLQKGDKTHAKEELKKSLEANPSADEKDKIRDLLNRL